MPKQIVFDETDAAIHRASGANDVIVAPETFNAVCANSYTPEWDRFVAYKTKGRGLAGLEKVDFILENGNEFIRFANRYYSHQGKVYRWKVFMDVTNVLVEELSSDEIATYLDSQLAVSNMHFWSRVWRRLTKA